MKNELYVYIVKCVNGYIVRPMPSSQEFGVSVPLARFEVYQTLKELREAINRKLDELEPITNEEKK